MATFTFGRAIDIHWNGYDIQGTAGTVFSIPDQLYEEFDADIAPVEPTLVWVDTNEFQTLSNSVSVTTLTGTIPISVTTTTSGKVVAISSTTNPAGYTLVADGTGGVIFQAGSTGALTSVVGISPISSIISGNTVSVILNANYQTAGSYQASGNYASSVSATLPISASLSTAGAVSISIDTTGFQSAGSYQASGTYVNAVIGTSPASVSTASGTSTVSIVAGSINSTHLSATSVGSSQLISQAVGTSAISSGAAANGTVLTANGSGGVTFASAGGSGGYYVTGTGLVNGSNLTSMATGPYLVGNPDSTSIEVISSAGVTSTVAQSAYVYSSQRTSTSTRYPVMSSWVSVAPSTSTSEAGSRFINSEFWIFGAVSTAASAGLHRSSDAVSWTSVTTGLADGDVIQDIAYNGSDLYVLCGRNSVSSVGKVSTSPGTSGSTWTARSISANMKNAYGVASSGSRWVVVGDGSSLGETLTSTDGVTWASNSVSGSTSLNAVAFGGSTFVAVGASGKIFTSPSTSGATWTSRTSGVATTINDVTYANGIFAACTASAVLTSSDGITWTSSSVGVAVSSIVYATFTNNGSRWVATGSTNNWAFSVNSPPSGWTTGTRGNLTSGNTISYNNNILLSAKSLDRATRAVETTSFNSVWTPLTEVTG